MTLVTRQLVSLFALLALVHQLGASCCGNGCASHWRTALVDVGQLLSGSGGLSSGHVHDSCTHRHDHAHGHVEQDNPPATGSPADKPPVHAPHGHRFCLGEHLFCLAANGSSLSDLPHWDFLPLAFLPATLNPMEPLDGPLAALLAEFSAQRSPVPTLPDRAALQVYRC